MTQTAVQTSIQLHGAVIICLANAHWDVPTRVNCHHIMTRLAADNQVLFVESIGGRNPSLSSSRDLSKIFRRLWRASQGVRRPLANLTVLSPLALPGGIGPWADQVNRSVLRWQIQRAARRLRGRPVILWIFAPSFAPLARRLPADLVIYQCVDEQSANPGAQRAHIQALERQLLREADVVIATSRPLFDAKRDYAKSIFYLPNVADAPLFMQALEAALPVPADLAGLHKPVAGFVGNLSSYKVDFQLLYQLARHNPDWSFALIGESGIGESRTNLGQLMALPNIHWLGPRPYPQLPAYIKGFDVCLIPAAANEVTAHSFPMKFFEYLAAGKPVVATPLPVLQEYAAHCYLAEGVETFSAAMRQALDESVRPEQREARVALAQAHSWDMRMTQLAAIIREAMQQGSVTGQKAS